MPMRGLLKRDDPKLQAISVASTHQVLLGSYTRRRMPLELRCRSGSCRCACMCAMSLYLDVYRILSCGASSDAEAFIRWRHAALTTSSAAASRILGRPCLHPPHASPGLSSGCLCLVTVSS